MLRDISDSLIPGNLSIDGKLGILVQLNKDGLYSLFEKRGNINNPSST